jgi:CDP-diglyceride synthetase
MSQFVDFIDILLLTIWGTLNMNAVVQFLYCNATLWWAVVVNILRLWHVQRDNTLNLKHNFF